LTEYGASHLSDNVVLLQYRGIDSTVARTITILKTRGSLHDPRVQEFHITTDGIVLAKPATSRDID
jgi:circadian clock protein KaiC